MNSLNARLGAFGLLRCSGPDAIAFLQGQISNDARRLSMGETLLAAYSNPQGRVIAVLHLLPHPSGILAVLPRELVEPVALRLRRFVLRAKVEITDASDMFSVWGCHSADELSRAGLPIPESPPAYREAAGFGIAAVSGDAGRYWVIGPADRATDTPDRDAERVDAGRNVGVVEHAWRLADVRAGLPQIYGVTSESFVAQMLNLDLLGGISFTKGCYTGQEIIARTQHLGRIKRRMLRLELPDGEFQRGAAVRLPDGRSGRLTELAATGGGVEALAVMSLEPGDSEDREGTTLAVRELPLPYALVAAAP
jgi:folate-binding protein YgfZ